MKVGFIGLGIMGKPMAKNLCRAGYTLIVNDHHKENVDELVQAGARSGDLKQIGMESDVVITMLPNSPQVKDVMLGENGIAGYMKKGTCFIDMSSINPVDSRYIGDVLKEKGIDMLDAPVSGGEPKAIDGKDLIKNLQEKYGSQIEILAGSGMNASNAKEMMKYTGINQVHSSCKDWVNDATTHRHEVSYAYAPVPHENDYDVVSKELVEKIVESIK